MKKSKSTITVVRIHEYDYLDKAYDGEGEVLVERIARTIVPYKGGRDRDLRSTHGFVSYKGYRCLVTRHYRSEEWKLDLNSPHNWKANLAKTRGE